MRAGQTGGITRPPRGLDGDVPGRFPHLADVRRLVHDLRTLLDPSGTAEADHHGEQWRGISMNQTGTHPWTGRGIHGGFQRVGVDASREPAGGGVNRAAGSREPTEHLHRGDAATPLQGSR
jgi:hypothetical protein